RESPYGPYHAGGDEREDAEAEQVDNELQGIDGEDIAFFYFRPELMEQLLRIGADGRQVFFSEVGGGDGRIDDKAWQVGVLHQQGCIPVGEVADLVEKRYIGIEHLINLGDYGGEGF